MLPTSLEAATIRMMRPDSIAREVFGNEFVDHYGGTREHEVRLWNQAVTNWEGVHSTVAVSLLGYRSDNDVFFLLVERYLELA